MNYRGLELKLREMIEERLEEGWNVEPGGFFVDVFTGQCCAVGAAGITHATLAHHGAGALRTAQRRLGITENQALSISDGFEDKPWIRDEEDKELRAIGARIRRDYCEWTNA